jgi:hypothetical protein
MNEEVLLKVEYLERISNYGSDKEGLNSSDALIPSYFHFKVNHWHVSAPVCPRSLRLHNIFIDHNWDRCIKHDIRSIHVSHIGARGNGDTSLRQYNCWLPDQGVLLEVPGFDGKGSRGGVSS